jgi:hypothetical protein
MGNHLRARDQLKSRYVRRPVRLHIQTQPVQTADWIQRSRKFMEKCAPDTTNFCRAEKTISTIRDGEPGVRGSGSQRTLLTTVIRILAAQ